MDPTKEPAQKWAMSPVNSALMAVSSSLSIIGCSFIIVSYMLYKNIRTSSRHIIVCISLADFIVAVSNLSGLFIEPNTQTKTICIIQSFISTTAVLCSFLWTMMLAVFLYITIVRENVFLAEQLIHPYFHLISWLIPLVINILALFLHALGNSGDASTSGWCWIDLSKDLTKKEKVMWMLIDGKAIEIITYIVVLVLYVRIKIFLNKKIRGFEHSENCSSPIVAKVTVKAAKTTDRKLILVPILLILLRIWGTIRFFVFIFHPHTKRLSSLDRILITLQAIGDNFQGAVNCVLFCFLTPKVWNHIRDSFHKCMDFCCCRTADASVALMSDEGANLIPEVSHSHYTYYESGRVS